MHLFKGRETSQTRVTDRKNNSSWTEKDKKFNLRDRSSTYIFNFQAKI